MKVLRVEQARAIWLFPTAEINPSGKYIYPLIGELINRYKFVNVPNISEAIKANKGLVLGSGAFSNSAEGTFAGDLSIYNDGLIVDTNAHTDISEAFLDDVLQWAQKEFGLLYPKTIRKRYGSKLYVETDSVLNSLNKKLEEFARLISEKSTALANPKYELGGINFTAEQTGALESPIFRFERAEKLPYSENRYYSFAGLSTRIHLELLERLEAIMTS